MHGACFFGQEYLNRLLVRIERGDFVGKAARPHLHVGPLLATNLVASSQDLGMGWTRYSASLSPLSCCTFLFSDPSAANSVVVFLSPVCCIPTSVVANPQRPLSLGLQNSQKLEIR
jgi:hypothetical protein